jgi:hypothetical protein
VIPPWVGPTIAISLVVIAASFLVIGGITVATAVIVRKRSRRAAAQLAALSADAKVVTGRLRTELEAYADLSSEARGKLRGAVDALDGRLRDLDALAEVLQEELSETALDVAAFLRTVRRGGAVLGAARGMMKRRRRSGSR